MRAFVQHRLTNSFVTRGIYPEWYMDLPERDTETTSDERNYIIQTLHTNCGNTDTCRPCCVVRRCEKDEAFYSVGYRGSMGYVSGRPVGRQLVLLRLLGGVGETCWAPSCRFSRFLGPIEGVLLGVKWSFSDFFGPDGGGVGRHVASFRVSWARTGGVGRRSTSPLVCPRRMMALVGGRLVISLVHLAESMALIPVADGTSPESR